MASQTLPAIRFTKREQLVDALEARRPWARAYDAKALKDHKAAEKAALQAVRDRCREVARMSYEDLKNEDRYSLVKFERPRCPRSVEVSLDQTLTALRQTRQEVWTITPDGANARIHFLLTHDETLQPEMC